jgi:hypothetical protein
MYNKKNPYQLTTGILIDWSDNKAIHVKMLIIRCVLTYVVCFHRNCVFSCNHNEGRHGCDLQLPVQSVPITNKVVSSNPAHGEVYSIQHYTIKFVRKLGVCRVCS